MNKERTIATLTLDGGALCFHFINTVYSWTDENTHEYLDSYDTLIAWCRKVEVLSEEKRRALLEAARNNSDQAGNALRKIKQVRELLYHFFSALAAHEPQRLQPGQLNQFNKIMGTALSRIRFTVQEGHISAGWDETETDLLAPLWPVMKSAYDILTLEDPHRIKECEVCGWIMLDHTKNNKRRFCSPLTCGSIEKSRKYYRKKRGTLNAER